MFHCQSFSRSCLSGLCVAMLSILCVSCTESNPFIGDKDVFICGKWRSDIKSYEVAYEKKSFINLYKNQKLKFTDKVCITDGKTFDVEYRKKDNNVWSIRNKNNDEWYDFKFDNRRYALSDMDKSGNNTIFLADVKTIKEKAEKNDASAQFTVGIWHKLRMFGCDSWDEAVTYLRRASEQGHLDAKCTLADIYIDGPGKFRNVEKGLSLYESAAEEGFWGAQFNLGNKYYFGEIVKKDLDKALKYYKLALEGCKKSDLPDENKKNLEDYLNEKIRDIGEEMSKK